jgi:thiamine kinase-like enzyme
VKTIPQADELPGLDALLDGDVVRLLLEAKFDGSNVRFLDCRPDHVRYRRRKSYIASYIVRAQDPASDAPHELVWYIRCMTADSFARIRRRAAARTWTKPRIGPPVTELPQYHAILFAYPNDYHLEGLRIAEDHDALRQALSEHTDTVGSMLLRGKLQTTLVRYRPEDRAVLAGSFRDTTSSSDPCETRVYFKMRSDNDATRSHGTTERLLRFLGAGSKLEIPPVVGYLAPYRMSILGEVSGVPISSLAGTSQEREAFARVGESLARLHAYRDDELPRLTLAEYLVQTERTLNRLRRLAPSLRDQAQEIKHKLAAGAPRDEERMLGFVHGDLLPGNILVAPTTIGLLDLDLAYTGCVAADIGKFFAHLSDDRLREGGHANNGLLQDAFMDAYSKCSGQSFDPRVLRWWIATAVIRRVGRSFRQLKPDKQEAAEQRLRAARELLDETV